MSSNAAWLRSPHSRWLYIETPTVFGVTFVKKPIVLLLFILVHINHPVYVVIFHFVEKNPIFDVSLIQHCSFPNSAKTRVVFLDACKEIISFQNQYINNFSLPYKTSHNLQVFSFFKSLTFLDNLWIALSTTQNTIEQCIGKSECNCTISWKVLAVYNCMVLNCAVDSIQLYTASKDTQLYTAINCSAQEQEHHVQWTLVTLQCTSVNI